MLMEASVEQEEGIIEDANGDWWAVWIDHANRVIRARLKPGSSSTQRRKQAFEAAEKYQQRVAQRLAEKATMDEEALLDLAGRAAFPREVVAQLITGVCYRIAREEGLAQEEGKIPGKILFFDRIKSRMAIFGGGGWSQRDMDRILDDLDRISVRPEIVDAICCEFNKDLNDVIDSALEWANQEGRWQHRTGTVDCWPVGYATNKEKKEMCDEWPDCHPTKKTRCLLCPRN